MVHSHTEIMPGAAESQPHKPGKGFLTSDFNRRGEFTDTIRSEQHRAQLKVCVSLST